RQRASPRRRARSERWNAWSSFQRRLRLRRRPAVEDAEAAARLLDDEGGRRRPGAGKGFGRIGALAARGQILVAARNRLLAGGREVMPVTPRRAPIGANIDAGLVVVDDDRSGAAALGRIVQADIAVGRRARQICRASGRDPGEAGAEANDVCEHAHALSLHATTPTVYECFTLPTSFAG